MKIGILTFHAADNYGAVLQAFGLKEALIKGGHEVYIIDYRPQYLTAPYKTMRAGAYHGVKAFAKALSVGPIRLIKRRHFERFRQTYLNLLPVDKLDEMDVLITGSDQIWNPDITGGSFDDKYLLVFEDVKAQRFSYAASAGNAESFRQNIDAKTLSALKGLDSISVREQSLGDELKGLGIESTTVLDPVLLAGDDIFNRLADKSLVPKEPYLLEFSLWNVPELNKRAVIEAERAGLRHVKCLSVDESLIKGRLIQAASVEQFVSLLKYASAVLTSSFHGTAFSIMFGKPFLSVGLNPGHSERAKNLLESIGLENRFSLMDNLSPLDMDNKDIVEANKKLEFMRKVSYVYVNQQITPPIQEARTNNQFMV